MHPVSLVLRTGASHKIGYYRKPNWVSQNSVYLQCKVSMGDGDAADGYVTVTCPDLSA